jgi:hypothetical protein
LDGQRLQTLLDEGMLMLSNDNIQTTSAGRQRLNAVLSYLVAS